MPRKKVTKRSYSLEDKQKAAIEYAVVGSYTQAAKVLGMPKETVIHWSKHWEGWDTLITQVHAEKAQQHRAKYSLIVDKAQNQILLKLPSATAAQASVIAGIATDKITLADRVDQVKVDNKSVTEAIKELASTFKQLSDTYKAKDTNVVATIKQPLTDDT